MPQPPRAARATAGSARPTASNAPLRSPRDLSRPLPAALSWITLAVFVGVLLVLTAVGEISLLWVAVVGALSVVAFVSYAVDKFAAGRDRRRVPERSLLFVGVLGGWPGALVAQQVLRHKTRKRSFRRRFWGTVVLNVIALVAILAVLRFVGA